MINLKKIFGIIIGSMIFALYQSPMTEAYYSIDDAQRDYGGIKITTDVLPIYGGHNIYYRYGEVLALYQGNNTEYSILKFYLVESKTIHGNKSYIYNRIKMCFYYKGDDDIEFNTFILNDGNKTHTIRDDNPLYPPYGYASYDESIKYEPTALSKNDLADLKKVKEITVTDGKKHYKTFSTNSEDYQKAMEIIDKFLFE